MERQDNIRIACVIITYHPDEQVYDNLRSLSQLKRIFVLDNTEAPLDEFAARLLEFPNVSFIHDGINKGIGARLNQAAGLASDEGYGWLLTMDQDSFFGPGILQNYIGCMLDYPQIDEVAMFGVSFTTPATAERACSSKKDSILITSGSMVNLSLFEKVGKFDEWMFIDLVDTEFCLRIRRLKYQCIQFGNIVLDHQLGTTLQRRSLKDLALSSRVVHSPFRMFYMVRNYFYVRDMYKREFPSEITGFRADLINRVKNNLLYGKHRFSTLGKVIAGYRAFTRDRKKRDRAK